jgi:hypothetical protein
MTKLGDMESVTSAVEDYAKAIYALESRAGGAVSTNALAERLDGVEEAAVVRSALAAGVPEARVLDELQREVERRLARLRQPED